MSGRTVKNTKPNPPHPTEYISGSVTVYLVGVVFVRTMDDAKSDLQNNFLAYFRLVNDAILLGVLEVNMEIPHSIGKFCHNPQRHYVAK